MNLYMDWGDAWDLMFRSFLVFIFVGLVWLKYVDPVISCAIGFPIPLLAGALYFYLGWRKARDAYFEEMEPEGREEV